MELPATPDEVLERAQLEVGVEKVRPRLVAALAQIPAEQRRAFELHKLRRLTLKDAALLAGVSLTTMQKRVDLAIDKLEQTSGLDDIRAILRKPEKSKRPHRVKKPATEKKPPRINWKKRLADNLAARPEAERLEIEQAMGDDKRDQADRLRTFKSVSNDAMVGAHNDSQQRSAGPPASPEFVAVVGDADWKAAGIAVSKRPRNRKLVAVEDRRALNAEADKFLRETPISPNLSPMEATADET